MPRTGLLYCPNQDYFIASTSTTLLPRTGLLYCPDQDYFIAPTRTNLLPRPDLGLGVVPGEISFFKSNRTRTIPRPKQKPPQIFWQGVCVKVYSYHLVKLIIRLKGDPLLNLCYFRVFTQDVAKSTLQYIGFRNSWQPLDY